MGAILGGAAIIGGTSLLGGLLSKGSKPKIPELKPIDFAAEQRQAIQQNIASLEPATELAQKTTAAEQSQLEAQLRRAIPAVKYRPRFPLRFSVRPLDARLLEDSAQDLDLAVR